MERANADGIRSTVTLGTSFGCPFEGQSTRAACSSSPGRFVAAGVDELVFADTVGVGVPRQVRHLVGEGLGLGVPVGVHLHNTRSTGYANALVALESGATVLDASVGGIGGCPFAPRATGNIATEDLVYLLHGEGIQTGIDLDRLVEVAHGSRAGSDGRSRGRSTRPASSRRSRLIDDGGNGWHSGSGSTWEGAFTDLFLVGDDGSGTEYPAKTPSTPADPSQGVLVGVRRICEESGVAVGELQNILHGTTVATNAVLESKGARVGLITTQGFAQILHLARSQTPGPLAGWIIMEKPDPPASLADTREAVERMGPRGESVVEVDEAQVEGIVRDLVESGVESLTVGLINSYVNPAHEERIGEIVERLYPGFPVTLSAHVLPEFREYERTLTACMNSYVRPKVATYIEGLQKELKGIGATGDVNILRSDAGLMTTTEATRNPIYGILSGPSGGVAGALYVARKAGYEDILTFDMGGTSTDVALCQDGEPTIGRETSISHHRIKVPSVNVHTVGAGGGSIAHVPELTKALRVGPQSAGADPGPASYGRGGEEPTVTDANVVLGHLPPRLLGGEMELDVEAARASVQTIADAMGLGSVEEAAEGILAIVNENMAGALRLVSVQRGHDPREFALVAYGGAGPLHANAVAEIMGSFPVLVPPAPGLLCAIGDLVADFRDEFAQTYIRVLGDADAARSARSSTGSARARSSGSPARGSPRTRARSPTPPTCATTGRATRSP